MKAKRIIIALTASMLITLQIVTAYAAVSDKMPEIESKDKSLTIYFYIEKAGTDKPIDGAKIEIYKAANLSCENGSARYNLLPEYEALKKTENGEDVTFEGLSGTESEKFAAELNRLVGTPFAVGITNSEGIVEFRSVPQGMYLVREISSEGEAKNYKLFSPYIISVPLAVKNADGNYWKYDVLSEPKTKTLQKENNSNASSGVSSNVSSGASSNSSSNASSGVSSNSSSNVSSGASSNSSSSVSSGVSSNSSSNVSSGASSNSSSSVSSNSSSNSSRNASSSTESIPESNSSFPSNFTSVENSVPLNGASTQISSSASSKSVSAQAVNSKSIVSTILDTVGIKTGNAVGIVFPLAVMLIVGIIAAILAKKKGEE